MFFENIENSPEKYDIWEHYFPRQWKITKNNLTNKENIISRISLHEFLNWAQERIWRVEEDFDRALDDVSRNIFPEVEPVLWARILTFVFYPYSENRVKSVIERPWNFGSARRVIVYSGYPENNEEKLWKKMSAMKRSAEEIEIKNTFELTYFLFPDQFLKEKLEEYIKNLKELKYDKASKEENKRLRLFTIFEEMLKYKSNN